MAAVVAYYLSELASPDKRKKRINAIDVETYFKIADFPLPEIRFTLPNAKAAGYFNAVGDGEYELNAVGHNLVVHNLPRTRPGPAGTGSKFSKKGGRPTKHR
jgi:ABC-type tungstate transport system substrate-binding protein